MSGGRGVERSGPPRARRGAGITGFVVRFVLFWVVALAVVSQVPAIERALVEGTVASLSLVLRLLQADPLVEGNHIMTWGATVQIVPDCTPLMPTLVFWAAVVAFPVAWTERLAGLALGAAAVWLFNLLRVMVLIAVLAWKPALFHFMHVYLWQFGTLLAVTAMFMVWVRWQDRKPARA